MLITTEPDGWQDAAGARDGVGDALVARNSAAAASDLVSAMTAAQSGEYGATPQQIAAQAALVHGQLMAALRYGASAGAPTEAANAVAEYLVPGRMALR